MSAQKGKKKYPGKPALSAANLSALHIVGFIREKQIIGDPKAHPPIPAIIPVCRSSWWNGIKAGRFPKPVKLGPNTTAWRTRQILDLALRLGREKK